MIEINKQRFVFIPDFENDLDTYNKVCHQFIEKFFGTDAMLIIVVENIDEVFQYYCYWSVKAFEACQIRYALLDKWGVELVQKVDYLISGTSSKNDAFIDVAYKNRVGIISACKDDVFSEFYPSVAVVQVKAQIKKVLNEKIFQTIPLGEYEYILFHQGMGETLCFLYWMKVYTQQNHQPIAVICTQESRKELLELCPFVSCVITVSSLFWDYISVYYGDEFHIKNFNGLYFSNQLPWSRSRSSCMVDAVKKFLKLPQDAQLEKYEITIPQSAENNADILFENMHLRKKRTVFIVHNGINFGDGERNDAFWKQLVDVLKENNYDVVFNNKDEVYGCPGIFCSIYDTVKFAEKCENVISVSTGLTEVICALARKKMLVQFVWPGSYDPVWASDEERWEYTLRDIKLHGMDFVHGVIDLHREYEDQVFSESVDSLDYILDMEPEKIEELVQTLVSNIKNKNV